MSQPAEQITTENEQSKNNENYDQAITSVLQSEQLEMIEDIQNITDAMKGAYNGLQKQAKRIKVISDNTHPKPDIGSTVRILVPDVDRGREDARSILAVVLESTEDGFYCLGTKEGVIAKYYNRSEFSVCPANILTIDEMSANDPYEQGAIRLSQMFDEVSTDEEQDPYHDSDDEYGSDRNYVSGGYSDSDASSSELPEEPEGLQSSHSSAKQEEGDDL
ncbi:hypothetical protein ILUMI_02798 [Ignelater luminosus]|uniref:Uncharacterized protein n=1 Tax=Ignelater luminosus TaxID=2038154 RepID=A0A8K0GKI8_IGNLU|nr:hypothetical protein ILUMI_02798 [Ignelater luminosus]